jgi:Fur family zinc uptake transcriptional regulator
MPRDAPTRVFPVPGHDHAPCLTTVVERARRTLEAKGSKLTELRRRVLEEIAGSHHAVGAYSVLERLAQKGERLAPISVYRAIDALLGAGVIHRLQSRNAFFACHTEHERARDQLILACEDCGRVAEVEGRPVFAAIDRAAAAARFSARHTMAEVTGFCADCQASVSCEER